MCGVDLTNADYFYESSYYKKKYPSFTSDQPLKHHLSFDKSLNSMVIDEIVYLIESQFFKKNNINLYVLNKKSALYPRLPIFS